MLGSSDIIAFILTADPARAKEFYVDTLGLKYVSQDDYSTVLDAHGVAVRLTNLPGHKPSEHPVLGWEVPDIQVAARQLATAGVKMERYSYLEQDELGIWSAPDGKSKVAFFKDPEGNVLSIAQH